VSGETSPPSCAKCGTAGVPSYLVLSPVLQHWRCPDCFRIWTTVKPRVEQRRARDVGLDDPTAVSARAHCPDCLDSNVMGPSEFLYSRSVDYFLCRTCGCWWMVPKGKDQPATRIVLGKPDDSANSKKAC
jgi:hypothetical protein